MKIVAIDFETANQYLSSPCSLGIAIYEDGEFLDNFEWMIKPHKRYLYFTNTSIHGLDINDVINEKEFLYYYDELSLILKDAVIVAHNAPFDIGVLNAVCDLYGLNHFKNRFIDTVRVSRKVYPELYNHRLNTVCEYLGVDLSHHNAKSDSFGCLMILVNAMMAYDCYDLDEFMNIISIKCKENV